MPNWTTNVLTIEGDTNKIAEFISKVQTEEQVMPHILENLLPCPQELKDTTSGHYTPEPNPNWARLLEDKEITQEWYDHLVESNANGYAKAQENLAKYGYTDWYDWQHKNWGIKWGDAETEMVSQTDTYVDYRFETPWSPPIAGMDAISLMFPDLTFVLRYYEMGMGFAGCAGFRNGDMVDYSTENIETPLDGIDDDDPNFWDRVYDAYEDACSECEGRVRKDINEWN